MVRTSCAALCLALLSLLSACSQSDQERTREQAAKARAKAHDETVRLNQDANKLGREAKHEAHVLNEKIGTALSSSGTATNGTSEAEQKLAQGGREMRVEADEAGVKLDRAAMVARVKAKLANDVGLSTVTSVNVDTTGRIVTLNGTVDSIQQKQQAERAAMKVEGVIKVVNNLEVRP